MSVILDFERDLDNARQVLVSGEKNCVNEDLST